MTLRIRRGLGGDGKSYPSRPLSPRERLHVAQRVHQLRCAGGLTVEGVRAALAAEGITRSAGSIHADLHRWRCPSCSSADGAALPVTQLRACAARHLNVARGPSARQRPRDSGVRHPRGRSAPTVDRAQHGDSGATLRLCGGLG